jgi:ketosteroid isomerase-like protein
MRFRFYDRSPVRYPWSPPVDTYVVLLVLLAVASLSVSSASALSTPPFLPKRENRTVHKQIEALEMQWRQAQVSNDIGVIDHLLADDYVGISANGTIQSKAQALAQHKAGTIRITVLDLDDLKIRLYGDTAVVTSKADVQGVNGESDISGKYRYTRVYNRRLGQWKIVSFEASRMHDPDVRPGKH